jgi:hypothetical protein
MKRREFNFFSVSLMRYFKNPCFIVLTLLTPSWALLANTLGPTTQVPLPSTSPSATAMSVAPFPCYNSQSQQFLLTWYNNNENSVDFVIYDTKGTVIVGPSQLFYNTINPIGDITSCYNPHLDQYIITWYDFNISGGACFAILNSNGSTSFTNPVALNTLTSISPLSNLYSCYNSQSNEFFITWVGTDGSNKNPYFAIVNEDGTVNTSATAITSTNDAVSSNAFCCYNSHTNQYFITWATTASLYFATPYFAIYQGSTRIVDATAFSSPTAYNTVCCCYNSSKNEYLVAWSPSVAASSSAGYYAISDSTGTILSGPTISSNLLCSSVGGAPPSIYVSYNRKNNQYLLSALSPTNTSNFIILDSSGNELSNNILVPNILEYVTSSYVYNSYDSTHNQFLISWRGYDASAPSGYQTQGFFAFYKISSASANYLKSSRSFITPIQPNRPGKPLY